MKNICLKAALMLIVGVFCIAPLMAQEKSQEKTEEVNNKLCPVDFKRLYGLENKVSYVYEGKLYYFDSDECVDKFKEDPEGYLKEWEKKESFRRINIIND